MDRVSWIAVVTVALAALTIAPAWANEAKEEAGKEYLQGKTAMQSGDFEAALAHFEQANALFPHPGFLLRIGMCQQSLGRHAEAVGNFEAWLAEAPEGLERSEVMARLADSRALLEAAGGFGGGDLSEGLDLSGDEDAPPPEPDVADLEAQDDIDFSKTSTVIPGAEGEPVDATEAPVAAVTPPRASPAPRAAGAPVYGQWWFWAVAAGVVLAAGGGVALASQSEVLPGGTLGTIDGRTP